MRREGRIHGFVFNLESLCYDRASRKPTNRSKRCPGGCNIPRCRFCRLHPVGKSSCKSKGNHKARGLDITSNHLMDEWTLNRRGVNKSFDALHIAGIRPLAKWAGMKQDDWEDNTYEEGDRCVNDDRFLESYICLAFSSIRTAGHCSQDEILQLPSSLCQNNSRVQKNEGIAASVDGSDASSAHGHSDSESCWSEIGNFDPVVDLELDDWTFIANREEP